ncbi:MAG: hypothetical protein EZS28_044952, partial [Streblomastix strix]
NLIENIDTQGYNNLQFDLLKFKFYCCYPRLDENVSLDMKHLLKAPFSIHPDTGLICVPIPIESFKQFKPYYSRMSVKPQTSTSDLIPSSFMPLSVIEQQQMIQQQSSSSLTQQSGRNRFLALQEKKKVEQLSLKMEKDEDIVLNEKEKEQLNTNEQDKETLMVKDEDEQNKGNAIKIASKQGNKMKIEDEEDEDFDDKIQIKEKIKDPDDAMDIELDQQVDAQQQNHLLSVFASTQAKSPSIQHSSPKPSSNNNTDVIRDGKGKGQALVLEEYIKSFTAKINQWGLGI